MKKEDVSEFRFLEIVFKACQEYHQNSHLILNWLSIMYHLVQSFAYFFHVTALSSAVRNLSSLYIQALKIMDK